MRTCASCSGHLRSRLYARGALPRMILPSCETSRKLRPSLSFTLLTLIHALACCFAFQAKMWGLIRAGIHSTTRIWRRTCRLTWQRRCRQRTSRATGPLLSTQRTSSPLGIMHILVEGCLPMRSKCSSRHSQSAWAKDVSSRSPFLFGWRDAGQQGSVHTLALTSWYNYTSKYK